MRALRRTWEDLWTGVRPLLDGARAVGAVLPRVDRRSSRLLAIGTLLLAVLPLAVSICGAHLVARTAGLVSKQVDPFDDGAVVALLVALPCLLAVRELVRQLTAAGSHAMGRKVDVWLRARAIDAATAPVGIAHLEGPELRATFAQARDLSPFVFSPGEAARQLPGSVATRVEALVGVLVIAVVAPELAPVVLATWLVGQLIVVGVVFGAVGSSAVGVLGPDVTYLRDLALAPASAKEVRVFGLGPWIRQRFLQGSGDKLRAAWTLRRGSGRGYLVAAAAYGVGLGLAVGWIGTRHVDGSVSILEVLVVVLCLLRVFMVPNLVADVPVAYGMFAIPAVQQASDAAAALPGPVGRRPVARDAPADAVDLRGVGFGYEAGGAPVLAGVDLVIPAGRRLAIVGPSGSGKTTLIKVLCGLYAPDTGEVRIDGQDLRDLDVEQWRRQVAAVFQDFVRYPLGLGDNVRLGGTVDDPAALARAVSRAGLDELVASLPAGLETPLTPDVPGGIDLSGGQWQRVALARALYAVESGARLLILDEPTASLDAAAELAFFDEVIERVGDGVGAGGPVTTILVSHRFPTVRHADEIAVLVDGRIVERGDHDALLAQAGTYASLFETQAASFRTGSLP